MAPRKTRVEVTQEDEVIEGETREAPALEPDPHEMLVRREPDDMARELVIRPDVVEPVMSLSEAQAAWDQYRQLENTLLLPTDYVYFTSWKTGAKVNTSVCASKEDAERNAEAMRRQYRTEVTITRRKTKSAFRKMARFFGLYVPQQENLEVEFQALGTEHFVKKEIGKGISIVTFMDKELATVRVDVTIAVAAPNGKTSVGLGSCARAERGFTHPDHDIRATAFTRALNRAVSDMVGWGEVSAEEIEAGDPAAGPVPAAKPAGMTYAQFLQELFALGVALDQAAEMLGVEALNEVRDYQAAANALRQAMGKDKEAPDAG